MISLLTAGVLATPGCVLKDSPGEDQRPDEEIDAGIDDEDEDKDVEDDRDVVENEECTGEDCEEDPAPEIQFSLIPDATSTTRSHVAWKPLESASRYEMTLSQLDQDNGESTEVFSKVTERLHAQIPREFREDSDLSIQVTAFDGDGENIGDSDIVPYDCYECGGANFVCGNNCFAPSYGYNISVYDVVPSGGSFAQIWEAGHFIAYSPSDYNDLSHTWSSNRHVYTENITNSDPDVFDRFCGSTLTGLVYFVKADAGNYQYAVDEAMTTVTIANDAGSTCGTSMGPGIDGLNLLFNQNSDISPNLTCHAPCNSGSGSGGFTSTDHSWHNLDPADFPDPITIADDILGPIVANPDDGPGWSDDVPVADILNELAEHANIDTPGVELDPDRPQLRSLSLQPAADGDEESKVQIDLNRLRQEGPEYVNEVTKVLDDGLYILVRYYGGTAILPMALEHLAE